MYSAQDPNIQMLESAVAQLGELADRMVFLGGCAIGLLITDTAAPPIRETDDVDVITEIASLDEYYRLAEQLREKKFQEDQSPGAPICRWVSGGLILDVMPTSEEILGFSNEWYVPAMADARKITLPSGKKITMVTAPYLLATKLVAFDHRGNQDFMMSHDMEDIIAVVDGRPELVQEVQQARPCLREYLARRLDNLLKDEDFLAALPGHIIDGTSSPSRTPIVLQRFEAMARTM